MVCIDHSCYNAISSSLLYIFSYRSRLRYLPQCFQFLSTKQLMHGFSTAPHQEAPARAGHKGSKNCPRAVRPLLGQFPGEAFHTALHNSFPIVMHSSVSFHA